jgi:hypothetical protein
MMEPPELKCLSSSALRRSTALPIFGAAMTPTGRPSGRAPKFQIARPSENASASWIAFRRTCNTAVLTKYVNSASGIYSLPLHRREAVQKKAPSGKGLAKTWGVYHQRGNNELVRLRWQADDDVTHRPRLARPLGAPPARPDTGWAHQTSVGR